MLSTGAWYAESVSPEPATDRGRLLRRPLVLTGGPAAGKTTTGRTLAERLSRAAFVDVDDVRQLVVAGHEWLGPEGDAQRALGVMNAAALAREFLRAGFDVAIADVVTPVTARVYRDELPTCLLVHLVIGVDEARHRTAGRHNWITDAEFAELHRLDAASPPVVDERLDVSGLSAAAQQEAVEDLWAATTAGWSKPVAGQAEQ